jgi:hypothetical protein
MLDELNEAGNTLNIVVLDACRDNPFGWRRSGSRGLQVVNNQPADSIIVYATSAGSTAADGTGRNGLFTTHLLNNLKKLGLSVRDVFDQTGADVRQASGGVQIPAIYLQFFDVAYLGTRPAAVVQSTPAPVQPAVNPQPSPQPSPAPVQPVAPPVRPIPLINVYVAGYETNAAGNAVACYWKNGIKTALSGGRTDASVSSIAVSGSDVYAAGTETNAAGNAVACYWKNGVKIALSGGGTDAEVRSIAVSGSDVYAAGYENNAAGNALACYWKNGIKTALSGGGTNARAEAITLVAP